MSTIAKTNFTGNVSKTHVTTNVTDSSILNKGELVTYFQPKENGESYSYDWSKDESFGYTFTLSSSLSYTIPVNGWLIKNPESYDTNTQWSISVNGHEVVTSDSAGNIKAQFIVKKGDIITTDSTMSKTLTFYACKSEGSDWRPSDLKQPYDIWKNAVVEVDGTLVTRDQYIPNASTWNNSYRGMFYTELATITGEEGLDSNGDHLFYIQTYNIENGKDLFWDNSWYGASQPFSKLKVVNADFSKLTSGHRMFHGAGIESFNSQLPELTDGAFMFYHTNLAGDWNISMPKLKTSSNMFSQTNITSFDGGTMDELEYSSNMFYFCENLVSVKAEMNNNTSIDMFTGCSALETMELELNSFSGENVTDSSHWCYFGYQCPNLKSVKIECNSLTQGFNLFGGCYKMLSFEGRFNQMTNPYLFGDSIDYGGCYNLTSLYLMIPSVTSSLSFRGYYNLKSFDGDLSSMVSTRNMFNCCYALTSFDASMNSVTDASYMFDHCYSLISFNGNMSSLTNGDGLFCYCKNLASFNGNISSLDSGVEMFNECVLNPESVTNVLNSISTKNDTSNHYLYLGIAEESLSTITEITGIQIPSNKWRPLDDYVWWGEKNWYLMIANNGYYYRTGISS